MGHLRYESKISVDEKATPAKDVPMNWKTGEAVELIFVEVILALE